MERDPRLVNLEQAVANVAGELVDAGVTPAAVAADIGAGMRRFVSENLSNAEAAAFLRDQAAQLEAAAPRVSNGLPPVAAEMVDLAKRADGFVRTLVLAGFDEGTAVTALHNACIVTVARSRGAAGAAAWLRSIAALVEANAGNFETIAKNS